MPRPEKVAAVAEIKERLEGAQAVFLAEYSGLSVKAQQDLRRGLRAQGAEFKVVKMTLARRAAEELSLDELEALLIGPTGLAFADQDAVATAKVLRDFASGHEVFVVKGGLLGTTLLTPERVGELAKIESREALLAKLAGAMKAPMTKMAGLMSALPRGAATVFQQLVEKRSEDRPADDATVPVPSPAETDDETIDDSATSVDVSEDAAPSDEQHVDVVGGAESPPGAAPEDSAPETAAAGSAPEDRDPDDDAAEEAEEE